jgi:hypothetical protein
MKENTLFFYGEKSLLKMLADRFSQLGILPNPKRFDSHLLETLGIDFLTIAINIKENDENYSEACPRNLKFMHYWWTTPNTTALFAGSKINNIEFVINNEEDAKEAFFLLADCIKNNDFSYFKFINKKIDDLI